MEQDHLPCSCDQEVFERVWRRVMPEDRPDCPFTLGEDAAAPPAVQPPAGALPAVVHTAPAGEQAPARPVVGEEHDVPCLGASSAVYGAQLQRLIDRELADWRADQALSRRAQGNSGRVLATIAAFTVYVFVIEPAGFLLSSIVYLFAQITILAPKEKRGIKGIILFAVIAVVVCVAVYFIFRFGLNVMLPAGILG